MLCVLFCEVGCSRWMEKQWSVDCGAKGRRKKLSIHSGNLIFAFPPPFLLLLRFPSRESQHSDSQMLPSHLPRRWGENPPPFFFLRGRNSEVRFQYRVARLGIGVWWAAFSKSPCGISDSHICLRIVHRRNKKCLAPCIRGRGQTLREGGPDFLLQGGGL